MCASECVAARPPGAASWSPPRWTAAGLHWVGPHCQVARLRGRRPARGRRQAVVGHARAEAVRHARRGGQQHALGAKAAVGHAARVDRRQALRHLRGSSQVVTCTLHRMMLCNFWAARYRPAAAELPWDGGMRKQAAAWLVC